MKVSSSVMRLGTPLAINASPTVCHHIMGAFPLSGDMAASEATISSCRVVLPAQLLGISDLNAALTARQSCMRRDAVLRGVLRKFPRNLRRNCVVNVAKALNWIPGCAPVRSGVGGWAAGYCGVVRPQPCEEVCAGADRRGRRGRDLETAQQCRIP